MSARRSRAGAMAPLAYLIVLAIAGVAVIGIQARGRELAFESRTLYRAQARWAAESGMARARADLSAGRLPTPVAGPLTGGNCAETRYALEVKHGDSGIEIIVDGFCKPKGDRTSHARIVTRVQRGARGWRIVEWTEPPVPQS